MSDLRRFLRLYRPYRFQVGLGIFLSLTTLAASIALLTVSGWFIAAMGLAGVAGVSMNYFTPAAIIRAMAIIRTGGRYAERLVTHDAALKVTASFRQWFYDRLEPLAPAGLGDLRSADLFGRMRSDIDGLERFYLNALVPLCTGIVALAIIAIGLLLFDPLLALTELVLLAIAGIALPLLTRRFSQADHDMLSHKLSEMRIDLTDSLQGMQELMVYGGFDPAVHRIMTGSDRVIAAQTRIAGRDAVAQGLTVFCMGLAVAAGLLVAAPLTASGIDSAMLAAIPLLCLACFDAVLQMPAALNAWHGAALSARRIFAIADWNALLHEATTAVPDASFQLAFDHVAFAYDTEAVLKDVSFTLTAGQTLALTGRSGSGKTSIINLCVGFWQPTAGTVRLNGADIATCAPDSVRRQFGVALQKPYLFTDTIRANLLLANPSATPEDMERVCRVAGIADTIRAMPEAYETFLQENGRSLSGGQLRRLAIARALLKPAACLVLDEPGEGLDKALEAKVLRDVLDFATARGQAVIVCIHDAEAATDLGITRIIAL